MTNLHVQISLKVGIFFFKVLICITEIRGYSTMLASDSIEDVEGGVGKDVWDKCFSFLSCVKEIRGRVIRKCAAPCCHTTSVPRDKDVPLRPQSGKECSQGIT